MWFQDESGRVHTPLEPVVLAATLLVVPALIIEWDARFAVRWLEVPTPVEPDALTSLAK
jgi:hypothetical protein